MPTLTSDLHVRSQAINTEPPLPQQTSHLTLNRLSKNLLSPRDIILADFDCPNVEA